MCIYVWGVCACVYVRLCVSGSVREGDGRDVKVSEFGQHPRIANAVQMGLLSIEKLPIT